MKALVVIFILGAAFLCGHAFILEHLMNNTHLRGDMRFNTTEGVRLGYNGSLVYDNGYLGFEIANLGASFNAIPKPGGLLGNTTNGTVDYSGDIHVAQGKHGANVSVDGTAGLYAEFDKQSTANGGEVSYNTTLTNHGNWKVDTDKYGLGGTTGAILNISGHARKDGDKVLVKKGYYGALSSDGNFTDSKGNTTNFTITNFGRGGLKKKVYIKHHDDENGPKNLDNLLPSVAYQGIAGYQRAKYSKWEDDTVQNLAEGRSLFSGLIWTEKSEDNDTWTKKIKHAKSVDFGHKGKTIFNHKIAALYGGKGTVDSIGVGEINLTNSGNNFSAGFFKAGDLHHIGIFIPHPKDDDAERFEQKLNAMDSKQAYELDEKDFEDFIQNDSQADNHHHHGIKTFVHSRWGAGKGVFANRNDDNTIDVYTRGGKLWDAVGIDSKRKKPWHHHGEKSFNASFEIQPNNASVRNIQVKIGDDTNTLNEIKKRYQDLEGMIHVAREEKP